MNRFSAIDVAEQAIAHFDFSDRLEPGESITGVTKEVVVMSGSDATPSGVFIGEPTISSPHVYHRIRGKSSGATYSLRMIGTTNQGNTVVIAAELPCITRRS